MNPKMNHKIKIYDEVLKMFGIPHQKESPWYQDMFDKFCAIALHESAPVDGYDEKCYHECPNCNSRCNCNSQPCSCCSAPVDDVVDLREENALLKKRVEELEARISDLKKWNLK